MRERRRFKRLPMRGFMECTVAFTLDGKQRKLPVLSLSAGGMYVAINERDCFDLVKEVRLTHIHFEHEELQAVSLEGFVAHRMSLGEIGGCGIEFENSRKSDVTLLESFVERKLDEFGLAFI